MATLEKRQNRYRVVLRLNGKKISRSIKSENEVEAQAALARMVGQSRTRRLQQARGRQRVYQYAPFPTRTKWGGGTMKQKSQTVQIGYSVTELTGSQEGVAIGSERRKDFIIYSSEFGNLPYARTTNIVGVVVLTPFLVLERGERTFPLML